MELKIWLPYLKDTISQEFGQNANSFYREVGLRGHPARDFSVPWGTPILNCIEGAFVYSTLNKDNPDLMKYRAVCTMWDDPDSDTSYELIYGHCSDVIAQVGTTPLVGQEIASVGNTGPVYAHGIEVSAQEKQNGSKAGAHLHFQLRKCQRVSTTLSAKQYILDGNGLLYRQGRFYEVVDYDNGFNGCIDPNPFFHGFLAKNYADTLSIFQKLVNLLQQKVALLAKR